MNKPLCSGPCFPRCWKCPLHVSVLAYASLTHALACVVYLFLTRHLGSPFKDSLTPEQRRIKRDAVRVRTQAYQTGLVASILVLALWRPLA